MILTHLILSGFTIIWQGSEAELLRRALAKNEKAYRVECEITIEVSPPGIFPETPRAIPATVGFSSIPAVWHKPKPPEVSANDCRLVELEFYQEEPRTLVRPKDKK